MDYAKLKGFNYQPGYGATGSEIWSYFNLEQIEVEIRRGKILFPGMNVLRIWLSFDAYLHQPEQFAAHFSAILDTLDQNQLQAMPVLFNNWHSIPDFGGVAAEQVRYWGNEERCHVFMSYLQDIVGEHRSDRRVVVWDLCNEPFNSGQEEVFIPWLYGLFTQCKDLHAEAPITIGVPLSLKQLELVEPMCDVLTPHLYYSHSDIESYHRDLDAVIQFAKEKGKPLFAGETGWGRLDDVERIQILKIELEAISRRNTGFLIHMLNHSLVGDGHRPEYGYISEVGFMGCIEADGTIRKGHDIINLYM